LAANYPRREAGATRFQPTAPAAVAFDEDAYTAKRAGDLVALEYTLTALAEFDARSTKISQPAKDAADIFVLRASNSASASAHIPAAHQIARPLRRVRDPSSTQQPQGRRLDRVALSFTARIVRTIDQQAV